MIYYFRANTWANPAFSPEFIKSQSEGTYVTDIIVPSIKAALDGLLYQQSFISTYVFSYTILYNYYFNLYI